MAGPIEFLGDRVAQDVPRTEYGGGDGLIQDKDATILRGDPDASGGHSLGEDAVGGGVNAEISSMMGRAARVPLNYREAGTGVSDSGDDVFDPVSGRRVEPTMNKQASGEPGELSDLQPGA